VFQLYSERSVCRCKHPAIPTIVKNHLHWTNTPCIRRISLLHNPPMCIQDSQPISTDDSLWLPISRIFKSQKRRRCLWSSSHPLKTSMYGMSISVRSFHLWTSMWIGKKKAFVLFINDGGIIMKNVLARTSRVG
jgi:hypothetical protein